ncbi:hypothetical protein P8452_16140 [Trifolium repens]|nr:hypothetical protein P8452_16140 [Trifolium repens]
MSKTDNAILVFRYFMQTFDPVQLVFLYSVMLKLFKENREFEKAEKLFDEMLQRMVKPNVNTFSTMISFAIFCSKHHKAVEWFEMMPSFECEPDDKMSSAVISSYASIGNVDMALKLYRRAKKEKWKVGKKAFSSLINMYGKSANYDRCLSVYRDMKVFGVKPNMTIYNNMLCAMGRCKRAWEVKAIYEEMINNGISPNQFTYETVLEAYCKDVRCADEAIEIFQDMKSSGTCHPDSFTYTSLISMYSYTGKVFEAEAMLNEMMNCGFEPNILVLTSLTGCYGKAKRTDDVVRIFNQLLDLGISPDDRFCDRLLYVMTQLPKQEHGKIADCIQKANPKLGFVVRYLMEKRDGDGNFRKEAAELFNSIDEFVIKKSMCNSLIDLCVNMEVPDRARDLLNLGLTLEIYTNMQNRSQTKWSLYVNSLLTGTALTALHVWINDLSKALESGEELPPVLGIYTGTWKNKPSPSLSHGYSPRKTDAALNSRVLGVPTMALSH